MQDNEKGMGSRWDTVMPTLGSPLMCLATLVISFFVCKDFIFFLSDLYIQHGGSNSWPEIKSPMLHRLSQSRRPATLVILKHFLKRLNREGKENSNPSHFYQVFWYFPVLQDSPLESQQVLEESLSDQLGAGLSRSPRPLERYRDDYGNMTFLRLLSGCFNNSIKYVFRINFIKV